MALPDDATRDEILAAMNAVPETDSETRAALLRRFAAAPPRPAIRLRHGARPGKIEALEDGRWVAAG